MAIIGVGVSHVGVGVFSAAMSTDGCILFSSRIINIHLKNILL